MPEKNWSLWQAYVNREISFTAQNQDRTKQYMGKTEEDVRIFSGLILFLKKCQRIISLLINYKITHIFK